MLVSRTQDFKELDILVQNLWIENNKRKSLDIAIDIANEVLRILGAPSDKLRKGEDALDKAFSNSKFRNQKMELWFEKHPYLGSARVALDHFSDEELVYESKFYWLNESVSKARITTTTLLTDNWEDSELTMLPNYKVGIDFYLNAKTDTLLIVVSNRGNLRVLELSEFLTNTQIDIFKSVQGSFLFTGINPQTGEREKFEPQRTIHNKLWEAFELKEVNKKFYEGVSDHFNLLVQHFREYLPQDIYVNDKKQESQVFSSRLIGRLLFVWFLRKKGIIDEKQEYFIIDNLSSDEYYENKLKVLFFKTLNTSIDKRISSDKKTPYLNGGLFDPQPSDWTSFRLSFPVGWFDTFYAHLSSFNFTTDESSPEYEQLAIDPEMLGRVFENLLATIVPETSKVANERKNKGAFYTPREIVSYMCKESLKQHIKTNLNNEKYNKGVDKLIDMNDAQFLEQKSTGASEIWGVQSKEVQKNIIDILDNIKILDPAAGSGAFPIGMMQLLVKTYERLSAFYDKTLNKHRMLASGEKNDVYMTKLSIIQKSIFGVDIEPMAVEISRLRAWLSLIIDDSDSIDPLPNLDFNFVCANSLLPLEDGKSQDLFNYQDDFEDNYSELRERYYNTHDAKEKMILKKEFSELFSNTIDENSKERSIQLKSWHPFESLEHAKFFDSKMMFNIDGFDVVIGNPPYIQIQYMDKDIKLLYERLKYKTFERMGDIYSLFYEMGIKNLSRNGVLCYITSRSWMRSGFGESTRNYFLSETQPIKLIDLGSGVFESATVDTNILLLSKTNYVNPIQTVTLTKETRKSKMSDYISQNSVFTLYKMNEPWVVLSEIEKSIKNKIEKHGIPLSNHNIVINYGVKTGCNDAFIITGEDRKIILNNCKTENERMRTDELIRPILRGRDIKVNMHTWANLYIINVHNGYIDSAGKNIIRVDIEKYPSIKKHLMNYYDRLLKREDQGVTPFNLRSCSYMDDFNKLKICYAETNSLNETKIALDTEKYITDKTCFILLSNEGDVKTKEIYHYLSSKIFTWYMSITSPLLGDSGISLTKESVLKFPLPKKLTTKIYSSYNLSKSEIDFILKKPL